MEHEVEKQSGAPLGRRLLALFCAVVFLLACLPLSVLAEETAAERYKRLQAELEATRNSINSLEDTKENAEARKQKLLEEKAIIDELVELSREEVERTQAELDELQAQVAEKRQTIFDNEQLLNTRLAAIYDANTSDFLSQVLMLEDPTDSFIATDSLRRIAKHDDDLLTLLNTQREEMEAEQAKIDALLAEMQQIYDERTATQAALAQNLLDTDATINNATAQLAAQKEIEGEQYAQLQQAQKEMAAIAGSIGGSKPGDGSTFVGGVFTWPVPGYTRITCEFGSPDPNGRAHRGMDIGGSPSNGATIVACGDGTVITAAYAAGSYGNYIVIDHGDGIKTLYAHCDQLFASVGTTVKQGDAIATVGTTGFVTGAHLHLEVFRGNTLENPRGWLGG